MKEFFDPAADVQKPKVSAQEPEGSVAVSGLIAASFIVLFAIMAGVDHWALWTLAGLDIVLLLSVFVGRLRKMQSASRADVSRVTEDDNAPARQRRLSPRP